MKYWLFKSEPSAYSIDDLAAEPKKTTCWEGVRNYQARNTLRDDVSKGDQVFFYHSVKDPGIVGIAEVVRAGYPDHFAWDASSKYFDPKTDPENPRWFMVDIKLKQKFKEALSLADLKSMSPLKDMVLLQKGSRLSIQPVRKKEWDAIIKRAKVK